MEPNQGCTPELTTTQRELLESALRRGYFGVPRRVTLAELASAHGLSDREASELLRCGLGTVVDDTVRQE
jgi:predicted DNA binding protein